MAHRSIVLAIQVAVAATASTVTAQTFTPDKNIELFIGPMIAPSSIVGIGGAYVGIAEGASAIWLNPAAVANRYRHNHDTWFDYDIALDWMAASFGSIDLENNGLQDAPSDQFLVFNPGVSVNLGRIGMGLNLSRRTLDVPLDTTNGDASIRYSAATLAGTLGYAFLDGQLLAGFTIYLDSVDVGRPDLQQSYVNMFGGALGVGLLARPVGEPFRIGFALKTQTRLLENPDVEVLESEGLIAPAEFRSPWQLSLGGAYTIGEGAVNKTLTFGDQDYDQKQEKVAENERLYVTFSADLVLFGASENAVGFQSWAFGGAQPAGEKLTVGVRAGVESEFIRNWVRGRVGFYWEPSRFAETSGRAHGTSSFDVRLFELFWVWKLGAGIDVARDYLNWSVSLGFWH